MCKVNSELKKIKSMGIFITICFFSIINVYGKQESTFNYSVYNVSGRVGTIYEVIAHENGMIKVERVSKLGDRKFKAEASIGNDFEDILLKFKSSKVESNVSINNFSLKINGSFQKKAHFHGLLIPSTLIDIWLRCYKKNFPPVINIYYEETGEIARTTLKVINNEKKRKFLFTLSSMNVEFVLDKKSNRLETIAPGITIVQEPFEEKNVHVEFVPSKIPIEIPPNFPPLPESVVYNIKTMSKISFPESRMQKVIIQSKCGANYITKIRCSFNRSKLKFNKKDKENLKIADDILHGFIAKIKRVENSQWVHPEDVIENREADCQGISNTFEYLCKKNGIKIRSVVGVYVDFKDKNYQFHQWVQLYLGGAWIDWDPTFGIEGITPGHIFIFKKEKWLDYIRAVSLAKNMKITIRSYDVY